MKYSEDLYTVRYFIGLILPLLLLTVGVWSITHNHSFIPFIGGRFLPREIFGWHASLTGIGYGVVALFLFASAYTPFKRKYENTALAMKCLSFAVVAVLFIYLFFATSPQPIK